MCSDDQIAQPPPVADVVANGSLPPVAAAPPLLRVGQAVKRLRTAEDMAANGTITPTEVGAQFVFALDTAIAVLPGPPLGAGPPAWAHALLALPAAIAQQLAANAQQIAQQGAAIAALSARIVNSVAEADGDALQPVPNAAGAPVPAGFPATRGAIHNMVGPAVNAMLQYYGIAPVGGVAARRRQLRRAIGIRSINID